MTLRLNDMPAHRLVLSPAAKTDLKNIYQYGLRKWGQKQSDNYLENIKKQFWSLIEQPLIGIDRSELLPGTRSLPIDSHTLFYRVSPNAVEIIRVLHGRQDPQRHLK
jgi:toxin ParE1/3/4